MMNMNTNTEQTALSRKVAQLMADKQISGYAVERATKREITQSFVNRIKNGEVKTPSAVKLKALARGLGVPESELLATIPGSLIDGGAVTHERLLSIDAAYRTLSKPNKIKANYLIELIEREIMLLAK
jgi:transcriptional regulator with XRE-family HTH domain